MNFRLRITVDDLVCTQTLTDFLAENEGSQEACKWVSALVPGQSVTLANGVTVQRFNATQPRYAHFKVPINFDRARAATLTIDRDRLQMTIRPLRRRTVVNVDLTSMVENYLAKQAKIDAMKKRAEKIKRRRERALARRQS